MFEVKRDLSTFEFILTWKYVFFFFLKVLELSLNQTCLKQYMHAGITATYYLEYVMGMSGGIHLLTKASSGF